MTGNQSHEPERVAEGASMGTIRAAIFDVIDQGTLCDTRTCVLYHPWQFEFRFPERDEEAINRTSFVDAVISRIAELKRDITR